MTNLTNQRSGGENEGMKGAAAKVSIYNLYEAKTALSRLVDKAAAGEEIIIAKAGKPMARLAPINAKKRGKKKRDWGNNLLNITYIAPDFDEPVFTDDELKEWGFS
ncbi:MAG TPA: type II toxin-antitoxin system prevent-host-death family antitoxin [Acidobacteriaceae bacterium]